MIIFFATSLAATFFLSAKAWSRCVFSTEALFVLTNVFMGLLVVLATSLATTFSLSVKPLAFPFSTLSEPLVVGRTTNAETPFFFMTVLMVVATVVMGMMVFLATTLATPM